MDKVAESQMMTNSTALPRTGGERTSFRDFRKLYEFCLSRYPDDILHNLDVLYRYVWPFWDCGSEEAEPWNMNSTHVDGRQDWKRPYNEWCICHFSRRVLKRKKSLLVTVYPRRDDLQAFMHPIANILKEHGVPITVLAYRTIPKTGSSRDFFSSKQFPGCRIIHEEDYMASGDYPLIRARYDKLLPAISELCKEIQLNCRQRHSTRVFFWEYFMETILFRRILESARPSVIYGIHYILNPGYLAAIREAKTDGWSLKTVLMQHGEFSPGAFHDFKGADCVILWGTYFQDVLTRMGGSTIPVPPSVVIGNPKLEVELVRIARNERVVSSKESRRRNVVFVSEPSDHSRKAMRLVAQAVKGSDVHVTYKLHPGHHPHELAYCDELTSEGLVGKDQIAKDLNIYDAIADCEVVIGTRSTAILEAIAVGKPVLQILPELSQTDWAQRGILSASTEGQIRDRLRLLIESADYREKVLLSEQRLAREMFNDVEGAGQRVASYLLTML